jgi:hypothetical protein
MTTDSEDSYAPASAFEAVGNERRVDLLRALIEESAASTGTKTSGFRTRW